MTDRENQTHIAPFPTKLVLPYLLGMCPPAGVILDPFMGSGTTAVAARVLCRNFIGFEIDAEYHKISEGRINYYMAQKKLYETPSEEQLEEADDWGSLMPDEPARDRTGEESNEPPDV